MTEKTSEEADESAQSIRVQIFKRLSEVENNQKEILKFISEIKGGRRMLLWIASAIGAVATSFLGIAQYLKGTPGN